MRKFEVMNNAMKFDRDRGSSKLQLAYESMLLQNVSSLEEYLEYYDAALECESLHKIQDVMGKVKELLESMTSKARKKQRQGPKAGIKHDMNSNKSRSNNNNNNDK